MYQADSVRVVVLDDNLVEICFDRTRRRRQQVR